jgi:hypothetical protein
LKRRRNAALLAGSLVLGLAICELAVRVSDLAPSLHRVMDVHGVHRFSANPRLGWEMNPAIVTTTTSGPTLSAWLIRSGRSPKRDGMHPTVEGAR